VLAVTDHDTLAGNREAGARGAELGVRVIPGIELSVKRPRGSMHLLGYFTEPEPEPLAGRIAEFHERRRTRARDMVERLAELGAPVDWDDVLARAGGPVGRPHVAEALVAAGHVADRQEAFDRYLADGRPAHVGAEGLTPEEAVELVRASGGAPVLAHPASLGLVWRELDPFVGRLARAGLAGIEVHRPEHSGEQRARYGELARRWRLVPSGGSDFHRPESPLRPGDTGEPPLPPDTVDRLLER
jgi:hypothetical protein